MKLIIVVILGSLLVNSLKYLKMVSSESHNTRLSDMKQDLVDFRNDFNLCLSCLKNSIDQKFNNINSQLYQIEGNILKNITDVVNESIMSIKDSIIDALKEENMKFQSRVEQLEDEILRMEIAKNNHDQYTRRNNIEIQGIPARVKDEHLENKVIDIFRCLKISIDPSDIEDCHRLGNSTPKNTIDRFVNRKFGKKVLEGKFVCER